MWSLVAKKQANCDPTDPADDHKGDWWDHVAIDAEHRLVLAVVPGARSIENAEFGDPKARILRLQRRGKKRPVDRVLYFQRLY
jgi:hypothetical protein